MIYLFDFISFMGPSLFFVCVLFFRFECFSEHIFTELSLSSETIFESYIAESKRHGMCWLGVSSFDDKLVFCFVL